MIKFLLALQSLILLTSAASNIPALFWGKKLSMDVPALAKVPAETFADLVSGLADSDTLIVVFTEPKLSVEDVTQCKIEGETCFQRLAKISDKTFLSNVETPIKALQGVSDVQESVQLSLDGKLSQPIEAKGGKVVFIELPEARDDEDFLLHDDAIAIAYDELSSQNPNLLALYTGRKSSPVARSLMRHVRAAAGRADAQEVPNVLKKDNKFLMAFFNLTLIDNGAVTEYSAVPDSLTLDESTPNLMKVNFKTDKSTTLELQFAHSGGSWYIKTGRWNDKDLVTPGYVGANDQYSYRCGGDITFYYVEGTLPNTRRVYLRITDSQFMPKWRNTSDPFDRFTRHTWNCVGFFTPAIWAGLFVVFLLVLILGIGLTWIMDINSMDRFDDPKGKTITISASE